MVVRFTVRYVRVILAGFFILCVPAFISYAVNPGKGGIGLMVTGSATALISLGLAVRGARCATLEATEHGVMYRSIYRTRRWSWDGVADFSARDIRVGALGWRRRTLWLTDSSGREHKLGEINAWWRRDPNPVDRLVTDLRAATSQLHSDRS